MVRDWILFFFSFFFQGVVSWDGVDGGFSRLGWVIWNEVVLGDFSLPKGLFIHIQVGGGVFFHSKRIFLGWGWEGLSLFNGWGAELNNFYITSIYFIANPKVIFHFKKNLWINFNGNIIKSCSKIIYSKTQYFSDIFWVFILLILGETPIFIIFFFFRAKTIKPIKETLVITSFLSCMYMNS